MEKKSIGKFISALRRANGMTQRELGERLFVSDKTVSRWERDECVPDLALIPAIAEIFDVTADELIRGERVGIDERTDGNVQSAKSEKQFALMIDKRKKRHLSLSFISVSVATVGVIVATICNLGFARGLLGFLLGSIFFIVAIICQCIVTFNLRAPVSEDDVNAPTVEVMNTSFVHLTVGIVSAILTVWSFCIPLAALGGASYGITLGSWLIYGLIFSIFGFIIGYCIYKLLVLRLLIGKRIITVSDNEREHIVTDRRLLKKCAIAFLISFATLGVITFAVTYFGEQFGYAERIRFDNFDDFKAYVEGEYDEWYLKQYGTAVVKDDEGYPVGSYPKMKFQSPVDIDGNVIFSYYCHGDLYQSIGTTRTDDGYEMSILTKEAYYNGLDIEEIVNTVLLSLLIADPLICAAVYIAITAKRRQKSKN